MSQHSKELRNYFYDWYADVFGFGYGTGDEYYCRDLLGFFMALGLKDAPSIYSYNHGVLEDRLGKQGAWYIINQLCKSGVIEYGTSPRNGWLTSRGKLMNQVIGEFNHDTLYEFVMSHDDDYCLCMPDYCNHTDSADKGCRLNPFWYGSRS